MVPKGASKEDEPVKLSFFTLELPMVLDTLNKHLHYRLECKIRELAVSRKLVTRLPWGRVAWGDEAAVPGLNATVDIPLSLMEQNHKARDHICKLLKPYGAKTSSGI